MRSQPTIRSVSEYQACGFAATKSGMRGGALDASTVCGWSQRGSSSP
jgi:hypothetical protein